jgi:hypothetical protein
MQPAKKSGAVIAGVGMVIVVLAITIFTAYRSVHFIQETLPAQSWLLAFFALGALDLGLVLWVCLKLWHSTNTVEHAISLTMIGVDLLGMSVTFVADTVMQSGVNGLTGKLEGGWIIFAILFTSAIILSNVIAFIAYHLNSTDYSERVREQQHRHAIIARANELTYKRIDQTAAQIAPLLSEYRASQLESQFMAEIKQQKQFGPRGLPAPANRPQQPRKQGSSIPGGKVHGMKIAFSNEQPDPPTVRYAPDSPEFMMDIAQKAAKPRRQQPTAEEVVERYYEPEEVQEEDYIDEPEQEEATDFLSERVRDIPVRNNGKEF